MKIFSKKNIVIDYIWLLFYCYFVLVITKYRNGFQQEKFDGLCKHFFDLIQFPLFTTKTHWYQHLVTAVCT